MYLMADIVVTRPTGIDLVDSVKALADLHRDELGFHTRQAYVESVRRRELVVATSRRRVVGFVRYHKRRDSAATIYEIVIAPDFRKRGVGRQVLRAGCGRVSPGRSEGVTTHLPGRIAGQ